ncbi:MAG: HAD family hydrolase [bacterium]
MNEKKNGDLLEPRLISFDFGDTLVTAEPSYLERVWQGLRELGHPRELDEVKTAYLNADIKTASELIPKAPFSREEFEQTFSGCFFYELGLLEQAADISPPLTQRLVELRPKRVMMPGALGVLARLHEQGYPLAIISNNDGYTREKCRAVGIEDYFFLILDSTVEGINKPDPRIYQKALMSAGLRPPEVLHVGDLWGCDVLGARNLGMKAVWLANPLVTPEPLEDVKNISRLEELLELIRF